MSKKITQVNDLSSFNKLLSQATYTVVDFYADWCGPCKTIAPIFSSLAEKESKPGKLQFCKVDVDAAQDIARKYGVSAMPTFLVIKSNSVVDTIRGANPSALTAAVRKAANDSAAGRSSAAFQSKGYTLGSESTPSRPVGDGAFAGLGSMFSGNGSLGDMVVRFFALYFVSLFTFDAYRAAEDSPFNVRARR
ncbi:thioredoxin-domain-containing protein [Amniculicola lignicola CBS 123094]|uniref:Thioredoxin-domain-containing protein n=1 Tax=Amniculicola lignicola CBS 123094 TaxID=1392246 RepID=A0A6A5X5E3_9PLEO|nr:thioredoxin-domain-containing protein [Amniculicola lignicola CBS 123094]